LNIKRVAQAPAAFAIPAAAAFGMNAAVKPLHKTNDYGDTLMLLTPARLAGQYRLSAVGSCLFSCLIAVPSLAAAQQASAPEVVVTATRTEEKAFDLPVAIDVVNSDQIQGQQLQVNISETLNRVPGTNVQNKETYSQEQQITIRGFGARSQFGVRGIKLLADAIPASMPDGQGGSGLFDLSSAQRIEVLRGPFSALYGNHSGGVVQVFTEDGPERPTATASFASGSYDTRRSGLKFGGRSGGVNYVGTASHFVTGGYRDHSAAEKDQFNAKLRSSDEKSAFTIVLNHFDQPDNEDPLGLTAQQVAANRRQAQSGTAFSGNAIAFNARRSLSNSQVGFIYENALNELDNLRAVAYGGTRSNEQFLALTANGVSTIDRDFAGTGLRWTRKAAAFTVTGGADYEHAQDLRQGFANNSGVKGNLGRDEVNTVYQTGAYAQVEWKSLSNVSLTGGLRYTRVNFDSEDRFLTDPGGDNSGSARHSAWTPVIGAVWKLSPSLNLYANAGRSFETPTSIEIAFRPDGAAGMNFELQPSKSSHYEVGVKAFVGGETRINLSAFQIEGSNEIVVATNASGRTTYQNAGDTQRRGLELAIESSLGSGFSGYLSATWLEAKFTEGFSSCGGVTPPCLPANQVAVDSGNRIPGVPNYTVFGELAWSYAPLGLTVAGDVRRNGTVEVNDTNTESAEAYTVASLRMGFKQQSGDWRFTEFARLDNAFDEEYIGAVYVNDANRRYYAPAPERSYLVGASASYSF
jgi:iron complex outermembrane recepter protein